MLPGYEIFSEEQNRDIWENGLFVVDANFILNLYRYETSARDELWNVLGTISDRIWFPYYAALEFQRNRPKVIASQKKKFRDVKDLTTSMVNKLESDLGALQLRKKYSLINVDKFISNIRNSVTDFTESLKDAENRQIDVHEDIDLRQKIQNLFENKVGTPLDIAWVEQVQKTGDARYADKFPPGYCDIGKGKDLDPDFTYGGIKYERKYGDLIIWHEIIDVSKLRQGKHIVFLTDDAKEDWWWIVDSGGDKRIGARPELVEEIVRLGKAASFTIYSPESFLQLSKKYLNSQISDETIEQARSVSAQQREPYPGSSTMGTAFAAIHDWLNRSFPGYILKMIEKSYPDFVLKTADDDRLIAVEFDQILQSDDIFFTFRLKLRRILESVKVYNMDEAYYVLIEPNGIAISSSFEEKLRERVIEARAEFHEYQKIRIVAGVAIKVEGNVEFVEKFRV